MHRPWSPSWSPGTPARGSRRRWPPWAPRTTPSCRCSCWCSGGAEDPTARVAGRPPRRLRPPPRRATGASARRPTRCWAWCEGAPFFLFCHDDCAPDPDAVHLLVEESYRSNAGDRRAQDGALGRPRGAPPRRHERRQDRGRGRAGPARRGRPRPARRGPRRLRRARRLHPRARRPVRRARRVRPARSWPWARTSTCAGGPRSPGPGSSSPPTPGCATSRRWRAGSRAAWPPRPTAGAPSLQVLQRRHELRAVLKCYGVLHLVRVLPQAVLLGAGEIVVAAVVPRPGPGPGGRRRLALQPPPPGRATPGPAHGPGPPAGPRPRGAAAPAARERPALDLLLPPGPPGLRRGPRPGPRVVEAGPATRCAVATSRCSPAAWAWPSPRTPTSTSSTTSATASGPGPLRPPAGAAGSFDARRPG